MHSSCHVLLCDFTQKTGWRIRGVSMSKTDHVGIIRLGSLKLLRIPTSVKLQPGLFCNPKTIVSNYTHSKEKCHDRI